ncbi:MAG: urease accessory protein UreD [Myxococcales bacterium]|nr:MAG: urease accessory protein UreD [Myxococcales bacterium]
MSPGSGWLGRIALELEKTEHGTRLARSEHEGPLRIQRVLTPEGPSCPHIYLLHPPGGVVGGDRLHTEVTLGAGAEVFLTTPAAQKLYRSAGARAEIESQLRLGAGAKLEWLPSETLAFPAAEAQLSTRVELAAGAAFLGWDIACYGMPARGEAFVRGRVQTRFELWREQAPLLLESFDVDQAEGLLSAPFALRGQAVVATLFAVPGEGAVPESLVQRVREVTGDAVLCGVSSLQQLLVVRVLGPNVERVRAPLIRAWQLLRPEFLGRAARLPRIWAT